MDKTCPEKLGFDDQEWVGIQHCSEEDDGNWDWGGCRNDPVNDTAITKLANDACDSYCSTTLWVGASSIAAFAVSEFWSFPPPPPSSYLFFPSSLYKLLSSR